MSVSATTLDQTSIVSSLSKLLDTTRVLHGASDLEHYGRDWTRIHTPAPSAIAFPQTIEEVQRIVCWANSNRIALVPSGGRTGLSGGAVAAKGEVVVSMERMRSILAFDPVDRSLTVQAGVTTQAVQEAARSHGLFYPVDFASRGSSQIGGNIATNAGGIKVIRYGLTRNWVSGLRVVTGTGDILDLNKGLTKNATGYDLRHLFIGSEGTLGFVVEATLQLTTPPPPQAVMVFGIPTLDALMEAFACARRELTLSAAELFTDVALAHVLKTGARRPFDRSCPYYLLLEFDADESAALRAFEECTVAGWVRDGVLSTGDLQNAELWKLRESITESLAPYRPYKNDIAVRVSQLPAFLAEANELLASSYPGFEVVWFGHIGDGNLHISVLPPAELHHRSFLEACDEVTEALGRLLQQFGGSISAEHGVGLTKKPYLSFSRSGEEMHLMREMRRVFDPNGVINPEKLL